jgi:hypothetical protein
LNKKNEHFNFKYNRWARIEKDRNLVSFGFMAVQLGELVLFFPPLMSPRPNEFRIFQGERIYSPHHCKQR